MLTYGERINSFGGQRSQLKVRIGIIDKCGVRGDATLCVVIFKFSFPDFSLQSFEILN